MTFLNESNEKIGNLADSAKVASKPSLEEFLAKALKITLEIQRKNEEIQTLTEEAEQLEEELIGFSSTHK